MKRRTFIAAGAAAALAPMPLLAASGRKVSPDKVRQALAGGETVFVDFYTDWCTTCRAQGRAIEALRNENPTYDQAITFFAVDWDQHANSDLARELNIPRRSTLVVLKGDQEFGRIVAGTRRSEIKELMDTALQVAMA